MLEWSHAGRQIPCWYYDPVENEWTENPENLTTVEGSPARYISLTEDGDDTLVSYLTPATVGSTTGGDLESVALGWVDALAFAAGPGGLSPAPGWTLQTEGCPEPLTRHESALHWEHPQLRIRFLGRLYGSLSHGIIAFPQVISAAPEAIIDPPVRIGDHLVILPDAAYLLP